MSCIHGVSDGFVNATCDQLGMIDLFVCVCPLIAEIIVSLADDDDR